jgi:transcriptional regulator with PAS, ATPase and Fis domain
MMRNFCEDEELKILAGFDFLDVCLLGETGTGKTHTARLIHSLSPRAENSFNQINCAELAPSLIESELFGYEKGAFTGAVASKAGKFEASEGGTLFLDEIGELAPAIQAKLLKVTEKKCVTRVGGNRARPVNVRIIYATHRNPDVLRKDLRYRITAHTIYLKPLRERRGEIVSLARLFLAEFSRQSGRRFQASDATLRLLENAPWEGNVRELRSFIEQVCLNALVFTGGQRGAIETVKITQDLVRNRLNDVKEKSKPGPSFPPDFVPGDNMETYLKTIENQILRNALESHNNNQARAAKELGISRGGLIKKLKRIGH